MNKRKLENYKTNALKDIEIQCFVSNRNKQKD